MERNLKDARFLQWSLDCIAWRGCVALRPVCFLHKDRLIGLVEVMREKLGS